MQQRMLQGQENDHFAALYANIAKQKQDLIARQKASHEDTQSVETQ